MDTLLEFLQDCQKKALSKGIDCSVDICFNSKKEAVGNIKMMYVSTTGIQESFLFETTVSESFTSPRFSRLLWICLKRTSMTKTFTTLLINRL